MTKNSQHFIEQLRGAPSSSGVYIFRDINSNVLYVGKAKNLAKRVQVYRRQGADGRARLEALLDVAADAEFLVTNSEIEAIILESQLIKRNQPPLNVLLKDDKSFLFIRLDTTHDWPRLELARKPDAKGEYYGPYPSASAARQAFRLIQKLCQIRDCSDSTLASRSRPCLKHGTELCLAPCVNLCDAKQYQDALDSARNILKGEVDDILQHQHSSMAQYSTNLEYESALRCRNNITALHALSQKQHVRLTRSNDYDVVAIDVRGAYAVLQYREGEWLHSITGFVPAFTDLADAMSKLLVALYADGEDVPQDILLAESPRDIDQLQEAISQKSETNINLLVPQRGEKRSLVKMALRNAQSLKGEQVNVFYPALAGDMQSAFCIDRPSVVDCIDVSHFQGGERVAAKVRFVDGQPLTSSYRRYLLNSDNGTNDDFAAMKEVVARVLASRERDGLADLLVLDGGRGQLNSGLAAVAENPALLPIIALAKARSAHPGVQAEERVFLPNREQPLVLKKGSNMRHFLERIRNEAHRFAISHHRHKRESLRLVLEKIPGVGRRRRQQLLEFCRGDLSQIANCELEQLSQLPGVSKKLAQQIQCAVKAMISS